MTTEVAIEYILFGDREYKPPVPEDIGDLIEEAFTGHALIDAACDLLNRLTKVAIKRGFVTDEEELKAFRASVYEMLILYGPDTLRDELTKYAHNEDIGKWVPEDEGPVQPEPAESAAYTCPECHRPCPHCAPTEPEHVLPFMKKVQSKA